MSLSLFCRTCGGFVNLNSSLDLFVPEQKELLQYIRRKAGFWIRFHEKLPTQICKNCQAEVIFPSRFIRRYSNAQYFFTTKEYTERKNLIQRINISVCNSQKSDIESLTNGFDIDIANKETNIDASVNQKRKRTLATNNVEENPDEENDSDLLAKSFLYKCGTCESLIADRNEFKSHLKTHWLKSISKRAYLLKKKDN